MKGILDYKLDENQSHQLRLLMEIDTICNKYGIDYCLGYGTLLGAFRHEGFIPWDADIDITMTEDNYDRFAAACKKELDASVRVLCDSRNYRGYPKVYGRYYDISCCRLSDKVNFWDDVCGKGVDIFYQIDVPAGEEQGEEFIDYYYAYDEYANGTYRHYRMKPDRVMKFYNEAKKSEKLYGREKTLQAMEARIFGQHFDNVVYRMDVSARYHDLNPIIKKEYYEHPKRLLFEGHMLPVPGDYLEILKNHYGYHFNCFPKEPKYIEEITYPDIPYRYYLDDFMRVVDRDKLIKARWAYKDALVEEGRRSTCIMTDFYKAYGISIRNHIRQKIAKDRLNINALLAEKDPANTGKLDSLFKEYYTRQITESPLYWRCLFDIGDDLTYAALFNLLFNHEDFKSVEKVLLLYEQNHRMLTDELSSLRKVLDQMWMLKKYLLYKDYTKAAEYVSWCTEHVSAFEESQSLLLQYRYGIAESAEDRQACFELAKSLHECYPDNPYFIKIAADVLFDKGDQQTAIKTYNELVDSCTDGWILLDIKKRFEKGGIRS